MLSMLLSVLFIVLSIYVFGLLAGFGCLLLAGLWAVCCSALRAICKFWCCLNSAGRIIFFAPPMFILSTVIWYFIIWYIIPLILYPACWIILGIMYYISTLITGWQDWNEFSLQHPRFGKYPKISRYIFVGISTPIWFPVYVFAKLCDISINAFKLLFIKNNIGYKKSTKSLVNSIVDDLPGMLAFIPFIIACECVGYYFVFKSLF